MVINGIELECDVLEVNTLRRIKEASQKLENIDKCLPNGMDALEEIESICSAVFRFFDEVFGAGTSKQIFGDKVSLSLCFDVLESFMEQKTEQEERFKKRADKYNLNRAQRRNNKK